ncbi:MAG: hypothetical protein K6T31_05375, partial [Alicyclobacillus sp.]|nr:hypothetical protein [Alicyclobacillus sp.]
MVLGVWWVVFAVDQMHPYNDPDTPWHLAAGRYMLSHHTVPTTDPFSWTMHGQPWVTQEWLFEVVFAWLVAHAQFAGGWLLQVGLHTLTVWLLYCTAVRASQGHRVLAAVLACCGTLVPLIYWTMRPQMVSYLMFAAFLWILQRVRAGARWPLWLVPPLQCVWANAHGSASMGLLMLLLEIGLSFVPPIGRLQPLRLPRGMRWRLGLAAVAGFAAGLLNPNGLQAYTYALLTANSLMTDNIMEWHSPDFHTDVYRYGVLPFLLLVFLILLAQVRTLPLRETAYLGGCLAMTLIYQRFTPYLAMSVVPLLAQVMAGWGRLLLRPPLWLQAFNGAALVSAVLGLAWRLPQLAGPVDQHMDDTAYPVAAVDYMLAHGLTQHVLNAYHWGGYLIYRGIPTFVDGRTDIFLQSSVFSDYLALRNVWWNCPSLLSSYSFSVAVFPSGDPIVTYLEHDPQWRVEFRGGQAEVLARVPAGAGPG